MAETPKCPRRRKKLSESAQAEKNVRAAALAIDKVHDVNELRVKLNRYMQNIPSRLFFPQNLLDAILTTFKKLSQDAKLDKDGLDLLLTVLGALDLIVQKPENFSLDTDRLQTLKTTLETRQQTERALGGSESE